MALPTGMSRPGEALAGGNEFANLEKVFTGEVMSAFLEANKLMALTRVRTITHGESATFMATGTATAKYHVAGESLLEDGTYLSQVQAAEKRIYIDNPLISSTFLSKYEETMSHYDMRSDVARALGHALAKEADEHIISAIIAGTAAAANVPGSTAAGTINTTGTDARVAAQLVTFAFEAAEQLDVNKAPAEGRVLLVRPAQYYLLAQHTNLINKDFTSGNGGLDSGKVFEIAGLRIVMTNNWSTTDDSAAADTGTRGDIHGASGVGYNVKNNDIGALAFTAEAAGTVKLQDLVVDREKITERRGTLLLAEYAMGHDYLRPECAIRMDVTDNFL